MLSLHGEKPRYIAILILDVNHYAVPVSLLDEINSQLFLVIIKLKYLADSVL